MCLKVCCILTALHLQTDACPYICCPIQSEEKRIQFWHVIISQCGEQIDWTKHSLYVSIVIGTGKYSTQFSCFYPVNEWQCTACVLCNRTAGAIALSFTKFFIAKLELPPTKKISYGHKRWQKVSADSASFWETSQLCQTATIFTCE